MEINMDIALLAVNGAILLAVVFAVYKLKITTTQLNVLSASNDKIFIALEKAVLDINKSRDMILSHHKTSSEELFDSISLNSKSNTDLLVDHNKQLTKSVLQLLSTKISSLSDATKSGLFGIQIANQSSLERLSELVQSLRIQNISELINELSSLQDLKLETEDSIKYLGECKITRIKDKQTGQDTKIYYENGLKSISETYQANILKYRMEYSSTGLFVKGTEFDSAENPIFEYEYDDAGEVSCKHQYVYEQGDLPRKITTQYGEKEETCI